MSSKNAKAYSEVYSILNLLSDEYKNKLPQKLIGIIKTIKDDSYNPHYTLAKNINEQGLSDKSLAILTFLNLNYWCNNEDKEKIIKKLNENEQKYQLKMQNSHTMHFLNQDKILEVEHSNEIKVCESQKLIEVKSGLFTKILNKIKYFFINKKGE